MFVQPQTSPFSHTLSQIRQNPSTTSETIPPPSLPISTTILHIHTFHTTPTHHPQALPCLYTIHNPFYITKTAQKPHHPNLPQGEEKETVHKVVWLFNLSCWTILGVFYLIFQCLLLVIFVFHWVWLAKFVLAKGVFETMFIYVK